MNQILNTKLPENKEKKIENKYSDNNYGKNNYGGNNYNNYNKKQKPADIKKVIIVFVIILLIFAISIIGAASYSIYQKSLEKAANTKPMISISEVDENTLNLKIEHDKSISKLVYSWNDEEEIEIETDSKKTVEQEIDIKKGINTLTIKATDINGQKVESSNKFTLLETVTIDFQMEVNNVKVLLDSEKTISYITYRWDEEEEIKIDINSKQSEQNILVPKGEHVLTIIAVDENNKTTTKEKTIKGVVEPQIETYVDETGKFIITLKDEIGLEKVELIANETDNLEKELEGKKEVKFGYPLKDGENTIKIKLTNVDGVNVEKEFSETK